MKVPTKTLLTPILATKYLKTLSRTGKRKMVQRAVRISHVNSLARQITAGDWKFNGDCLKIDKTGYLLDGQHRCLAVLASGIPISTMIMRDLDGDDVMDTVDQGINRSIADVIYMTGIEKRSAVILGVAAKYEMTFRITGTPGSISRENKPTPREIKNFALKHPGLLDASRKIEALKGNTSSVLSNGVFAFCLYRFRLHDPDYADLFIEALITGANLVTTDPSMWIRNRYFAEAMGSRHTEKTIKLAWVIKAWHRTSMSKRVGERNFFKLTPSQEFKHLWLPTEEHGKIL